MGNFDYIKDLLQIDELYEYCSMAEQFQNDSPKTSVHNCRLALEWILIQVFDMKHIDRAGLSLAQMAEHPDFMEFIGSDMLFWKNITYVRKVGNWGSHITDDPSKKVTPQKAFFCLVDLHFVLGYIFKSLRIIDHLAPFDRSLVGQRQAITVLQPVVEPKPNTEFIDSVPEINVEHPARPTDMPTSPLTEAETRKQFIDLMLEEAGWEVLNDDGLIKPLCACVEVEVQGMPTESGKGYVDYVLFGEDLKPLALIEAKRTTKEVSVGLHQAKLYADCLENRYGVRPVVYVSNGFETKVIDGLGYPLRMVYGIHSARDLQLLHQRRKERGPLADMRINENITGREYQKRGIKEVCQHLASMNRRSLLIMATGTGKTRVSISLCEILMRNNWVKNILFLADRTALVKQAHRNYVQLLPDATTCVLSERQEDSDLNARIMFSTYQTMIRYIENETKEFSVGRFDLIIIDEAHRSVFGKYGAIFNYFDSFLVGLTATPRDEVDHSTYDLLGMTPENTFAYEYQEAVRDGYLVDYKALIRNTRLMEGGIQPTLLAAEEQEQLKKVFEHEKALKALDPDEEYTRDIDSSELFSYIYNLDTIDKVLQELMEKGMKVQSGNMIGKSIIFCYNHRHAELVVERFNVLYPELAGTASNFCVLIDNTVNYAQDLIDSFGMRDSMPQIAVSVDMLDTGIDVPDVLNLVFFKPVHSGIKFKQMIGRGTRLCPDVFGPGKDKKEFYIFDWCNNFSFFKMNPSGVESAVVTQSLAEKLFCLRVRLAAALQTLEHQQIRFEKQLHDDLKEMLCQQVGQMSDSLISVREKWKYVSKFKLKESWEYLSDVDVMELIEIAPLIVKTIQDESAMKFDLLMLNIELSKVSVEVNGRPSESKVLTIANLLTERASIPAVAQHMNTIKEVLATDFFTHASMSKLEQVRLELRDLVKNLLSRADRKQFVLDIEDSVTDGGEEYGIAVGGTYRQKVLEYLAENSDHPVLKKIFTLEQLTSEDVSQLEKILWEELGTRDDYDRYTRGGGMNVAMFIRSIIKVDRKVALEKFSQFLKDSTLTARQEEYLKNIISYVCENGDIEPMTLMTATPFTDIDIVEVFDEKAIFLGKYVNMIHNAIVV